MWRKRELAPRYDVVIVGGGVHGLATAYYLAKLGVARVAVLEMSYIGSGGSGRNTAIVRGNYRTPEGVPFYARSVQMYERLGDELDYNLLFSQQGHLTLAHTDATVTGLHIRAEVRSVTCPQAPGAGGNSSGTPLVKRALSLVKRQQRTGEPLFETSATVPTSGAAGSHAVSSCAWARTRCWALRSASTTPPRRSRASASLSPNDSACSHPRATRIRAPAAISR